MQALSLYSSLLHVRNGEFLLLHRRFCRMTDGRNAEYLVVLRHAELRQNGAHLRHVARIGKLVDPHGTKPHGMRREEDIFKREALSQEVIPVSPISSFDGMISTAGLYMSYFSLPSALPTAAASFAIFSRFKTAEKCHVWRFIALGACTAHCKSVSIFFSLHRAVVIRADTAAGQNVLNHFIRHKNASSL